MNRANKIIVSIALALVLCTGAALLAQAFFQAFTKDVSGTVTVTPPTDDSVYYVTVSTEAELIAATKAVTYNDPASNAGTETETDADGNAVLPKSSRCIVLLTADITLNSDLLITRDCHIDLGGYTLDTNGYTVTVFHTYTGTFVITNGNMIGTLNVNTPNAAVLVDSSVNTTDTSVLTQNVDAIDPTAVCKAALSMVCAHLSNNLDHGIYGLLGYNEAKCELPDYSEHFGCSHTTGCCFSVGTPDLPYWFFGYDDLKITYTTTSADGVDTLTASVAYGSATDSQAFIIHNISATDYATLSKAASAVVLKDLDSYKKLNADGNVVLDDNGKPVYEFKTAIRLPDTVVIGTVEVPMTYVPTAGSVTDGVYSPADADSLKIKCGPFADGSNHEGSSFTASGSVSQLLDSPYTKANRVIKELLGTIIVIEKDGDTYVSKSWESDVTQIPTAVSYKVSDITYTLSNNENGFYELTPPEESANGDWVLSVTEGSHPEEYLDKVFVQATVTIEDSNGKDVEIVFSIPITCQESASGGDVVSQFLPYYHYFNELFTQATDGNFTYRTFYMPTKYTDGTPEIEFYLVDVDNVAGDGAYAFYSFTNADHATAINKILGAASDTTRFINVEHPQTGTDTDGNPIFDQTQWKFTIQPEYIGYQNREVVFGYWYQFAGQDDDLFDNDPPEQGKYTTLTVPGVVNQNEVADDSTIYVDIPDDNLYAYLYSILYPGESFTALSDYILYSDISKPIGKVEEDKAWDEGTSPNTANTVLNFEDRTDIASYEGLELLTGATGINLKNALLRSDAFDTANDYTAYIDETLACIGQMASLEYLNLANNGLTDGEDFTVGDDILAPLTALTKLEILHLENNTIYSFASLSEFPALEVAYVYGNNPEVNFFDGGTGFFGQILEAIDSALTDALQSAYGSDGAVNIAEYSSICHRVDVYNVNEDDKFSPTLGSANDFTALANLQYQDKIPNDATDATIQAICDEMQDELSAYGIATNTHTCPVLDDEGKPSANNQTLTNSIEFLYQKDSDGSEYIILRYHNHVTINSYKQNEDDAPMQVAVEYYVDFKYPLTRLPAETATVDETN